MEEEKHPNYLEDAELIVHINKVIDDFLGATDELANAIGVLFLGRKIGWKPTYLLHNIRTINKYQDMLGLKFKEQMPSVTKKADSLVGWKVAGHVSNFWKVVTGQVPEYKKTKEWKIIK
jgi:hypothetical protein